MTTTIRTAKHNNETVYSITDCLSVVMERRAIQRWIEGKKISIIKQGHMRFINMGQLSKLNKFLSKEEADQIKEAITGKTVFVAPGRRPSTTIRTNTYNGTTVYAIKDCIQMAVPEKSPRDWIQNERKANPDFVLAYDKYGIQLKSDNQLGQIPMIYATLTGIMEMTKTLSSEEMNRLKNSLGLKPSLESQLKAIHQKHLDETGIDIANESPTFEEAINKYAEMLQVTPDEETKKIIQSVMILDFLAA